MAAISPNLGQVIDRPQDLERLRIDPISAYVQIIGTVMTRRFEPHCPYESPYEERIRRDLSLGNRAETNISLTFEETVKSASFLRKEPRGKIWEF